ncbi:5110_t:CDS:2 [Entrophospora sp. SA101]|nr:5110_t:CDS:2 [Entrophospora sp. SA101]
MEYYTRNSLILNAKNNTNTITSKPSIKKTKKITKIQKPSSSSNNIKPKKSNIKINNNDHIIISINNNEDTDFKNVNGSSYNVINSDDDINDFFNESSNSSIRVPKRNIARIASIKKNLKRGNKTKITRGCSEEEEVENNIGNGGINFRCVCEKPLFNTAMIQCWGCNCWQHCVCVGIYGSYPGEYYCSECRAEGF